MKLPEKYLSPRGDWMTPEAYVAYLNGCAKSWETPTSGRKPSPETAALVRGKAREIAERHGLEVRP